jgi:hypothetical protein
LIRQSEILWDFSGCFQRFLFRICLLSFLHSLGRFDSLSDIWCFNRRSCLTIPRSDADEFMRHPIGLATCRLSVRSTKKGWDDSIVVGHVTSL